MTLVGVLELNNSMKSMNDIKEIVEDNEMKCLVIEDNTKIPEVGGLVVISENDDHLGICQLIASWEENCPSFVWIMVKNCDADLKILYTKLLSKSLVEFIQLENEKELLHLQIKKNLSSKKSILPAGTDVGLLLQPDKLSLMVGNMPIKLTYLEFKAVALLHKNMGETVVYETFSNYLWGTENKQVPKSRLANLMFHLREKLKGQSIVKIEIIRKKGYALTFSKLN